MDVSAPPFTNPRVSDELTQQPPTTIILIFTAAGRVASGGGHDGIAAPADSSGEGPVCWFSVAVGDVAVVSPVVEVLLFASAVSGGVSLSAGGGGDGFLFGDVTQDRDGFGGFIEFEQCRDRGRAAGCGFVEALPRLRGGLVRAEKFRRGRFHFLFPLSQRFPTSQAASPSPLPSRNLLSHHSNPSSSY